MQKYLERKQVVGIKLFTGHEAFYLTDERLETTYETAIRFDVPVLFHSGWENSQYSDVLKVLEIASKYPRLKLVCCHCFYPQIEKCKMLLDYSNVFFDLSSIADDADVWENMQEQCKELIELAPTRVLFGSDYACCSQQEHIKFMKGVELDKQLEENLFYKNAQRLYL